MVRLSAILVPIGTALVCAFFIDILFKHIPKLADGLRRPIEISCLSILSITILAGLVNSYIDFTHKRADPARALWEYITDHKQSGEIYLIPPKMQEFRLQTGAPAFVDFKSHPYKDVEVLEWYKRIRISPYFYRNEPQNIDCNLLNTAHSLGGVTHVILGQAQLGLQCTELQSIYQDQNYALFSLSTP